MSAPYKMKGFSGFGNEKKSPTPQKATNKEATKGPKVVKTKEYTKAQKRRVVEMNKKHKGKPGFQEYADKVFGGPTTFTGPDGMISTTTKDITAKK